MQVIGKKLRFNVFLRECFCGHYAVCMFVPEFNDEDLTIMKKLLLLPFLLITLFSCSTDDADEVMIQETTTSTLRPTPVNQCLASLEGYTNINVDGGFGNPMVEFYVNASAPDGGQFNLTLEIQRLSDCDNMDSNSGSRMVYDLGRLNLKALDAPVLVLSPQQLPADCYKWRFVATPANGDICLSNFIWYEAPLF